MLLAEHYEEQEVLPYVLSEMFYPLLEKKKLILSRLSQKLVAYYWLPIIQCTMISDLN